MILMQNLQNSPTPVKCKSTFPSDISVDEIIDMARNRPADLPPGYLDDLGCYKDTFGNPLPGYAIKQFGIRGWRYKHKRPADPVYIANLHGKYSTGFRGREYPEFLCVDFDDKPREYVDHIRDELHMNEDNSMLFPSESPFSFHLFAHPTVDGKPASINRLFAAFRSFDIEHRIEQYPQSNRVIRGPFSPRFPSLDLRYLHLDDWRDKLHWFRKLNEYDIALVPSQQLPLDLNLKTPLKVPAVKQEAEELLADGLPYSGCRNDCQSVILTALWRAGVSQYHAEEIVWEWINEKHNDLSKDLPRHPEAVRAEIFRQANLIYGKYEMSNQYPDWTSNNHHGWLTKPDLFDILMTCRGNMPRSKFLFHLVKYSYPRKHRDFIGVHRDKLVEWSSNNTYLKYLNEFESRGFLRRGSAYIHGKFSKDLKLNWDYGNTRDALLDDGRAFETLDDALRFSVSPPEFREMLRCSGCKRTTGIEASIRVYFRVSEKRTPLNRGVRGGYSDSLV